MPRRIRIYGVASVLVMALNLSCVRPETWRGIVVAPEDRCSAYLPDDYRNSRSLEDEIVAEIGQIYGPYTGRCFSSTDQTDLEHIVARSEAHDSGMCGEDLEALEARKAFANDPLNLTLASPHVNRVAKRDRDAAEWMPDENQCWFADRIVQVRRKHGLTIDRREADALERVLSECESFEMDIRPCPATEDPESTEGAEPTP